MISDKLEYYLLAFIVISIVGIFINSAFLYAGIAFIIISCAGIAINRLLDGSNFVHITQGARASETHKTIAMKKQIVDSPQNIASRITLAKEYMSLANEPNLLQVGKVYYHDENPIVIYYQKAKGELFEALKLDSNNSHALITMASVNHLLSDHKRGERTETQGYLRRAINADPNRLEYQIVLAAYLAEYGERQVSVKESALAILEEVVQKATSPEIETLGHYWLLKTYQILASFDKDKSESYLRKIDEEGKSLFPEFDNNRHHIRFDTDSNQKAFAEQVTAGRIGLIELTRSENSKHWTFVRGINVKGNLYS